VIQAGRPLLRSLQRHCDPYWGLVAFCLASPLSIAATNIAWAAAAGLLLVASVGPVRTVRPQGTALDPAWALFVLASILSVIVSLDPVSSLVDSRDLGLIIIYYLFVWGVRGAGRRALLLAALVGAAGVASLYGVIQVAAGYDFLGHFKPEAGRATGFFSLHLTFAEYLVLVSCSVLGVVVWQGPRRSTPAMCLLLALMLAGVVLSQSKGALLGLLVGWSLIFCLRGRAYLAVFALGSFLLVWSASALLDIDLWATLRRLFALDVTAADGLAASNTQRLFMWWSGFRISAMYLFNGVGMHALERIYPAFRHPLALHENQWHLHNNFVHLGVTTGMLGLAAFLLVFVVASRNCLQGLACARSRPDRGLSAGVLGGLAGFLVCGLTEACWEDSEVRMLLYALVGLQASCLSEVPKAAIAAGQEEEAGPRPVSRAASWSAIERYLVPFILLISAGWVCYAAETRTSPPAGTRVVEALTGLAGFAALYHRWMPASWHRARGPLLGYVAVYAVYTAARPFWGPTVSWAYRPALVWSVSIGVAIGVAALFSIVLIGAPVGRRPLERASGTLFDAAFLGALLLWAALCASTHLLLAWASHHAPAFDQETVGLLLLCGGLAMLYTVLRAFSQGGRPQRIGFGLVCLSLLYAALGL